MKNNRFKIQIEAGPVAYGLPAPHKLVGPPGRHYGATRIFRNFESIVLIILLLSSALVPASGIAQENISEKINAVQKTYQGMQDLSADFVQETRVEILNKTIIRQGTLKLKKGGLFRIEYSGDEPRHYVSDGKKMWIYTPDDPASLSETNLSSKTISKEALTFLTGFGNLKKDFTVSSSTAFKNVSQDQVALHLIPKSKKASFRSLDVLFDAHFLLTEMIVKNPTGNTTRYRFKNLKTDTGLPNTIFSH